MATPSRLTNFGDIVTLALARCKGFNVRTNDVNLMKGYVNEVYASIVNAKMWPFRKMDRSFVMDVAETTGTVSVTSESRIITFSTIVLDNTYLGRSIKVDGTENIYRIIGVNTTATPKEAYLDAPYSDDTDATANFNLYKYEFSIPPDCSDIEQVYVDQLVGSGGRNNGQIDALTNTKFNRILSTGIESGAPRYWCRDGKINFNDIPRLDEMILDYDFLGGESTELVDRLRIFPINPDKKRIIHLSYTMVATPMTRDEDKPVFDQDFWWILVHGAAAEYLYYNDRTSDAQREESKYLKMFKSMCTKYHVSDSKPRMVYDPSKNMRVHLTRRSAKEDMFYLARQAEYE